MSNALLWITNYLIVNISGSETYHVGDLQYKTTSLSASGACVTTLWVTEKLNMNVEGVCTVDYYDTPMIHLDHSGRSKIDSLGEK